MGVQPKTVLAAWLLHRKEGGHGTSGSRGGCRVQPMNQRHEVLPIARGNLSDGQFAHYTLTVLTLCGFFVELHARPVDVKI